MASVNVTSITNIYIAFQSGRMSCTFPKGTLEIIVLTNCNGVQTNIIEDRAFKTNTTRPWNQQFNPYHIIMQRHIEQLRQEGRETLKFLSKKGTNTLCGPQRTRIRSKLNLKKAFLLEPVASSVSGPSSETRLGVTGKDRRDLMGKLPL